MSLSRANGAAMLSIEIWSGGQTGVDRGALDAALELDLLVGGWCPKGRRAEDGAIPERYPVRQHPSPEYLPRTEANISGTDGTLVLTPTPACGGTAATIRLARGKGKPVMVVDRRKLAHETPMKIRAWIVKHEIRRLNVAGPRESKCPGIAAIAEGLLYAVLSGDANDAVPLRVSAPSKRKRQ